MKNKTIQILAEGRHLMPAGTKVTSYENGVIVESYTVEHENFYIMTVDDYHNHLDFSNVKPLYPHKGMEVPEEGIPFLDGNGELLDVGTNGFTYKLGLGEEVYYVGFDFQTEMLEHFRLKRTLPKTIEACAECHKEVCECEREEGWYRVFYINKWLLRFWDGEFFRFTEGGATIGHWKDSYTKIDWNNPINVTPEGEA